MKSFAGFIALALVSQCIASPVLTVGDKYADLISSVLKFCRQEMVEHNPLPLPNLGPQHIAVGNIDLTIDQTGVTLSKAETFVVKELTTDPATLTATLSLQVPQFAQNGKYNLAGTAMGKKVSGTGQLSIENSGFDMTATVTFKTPETSLQIESIDFSCTFGDVKLDLTGLTIEGMTQAQVQQFIDNDLTNFWKDKSAVQSGVAYVQARLNQLMAGKTLDEIVAWVEKQIHQ